MIHTPVEHLTTFCHNLHTTLSVDIYVDIFSSIAPIFHVSMFARVHMINFVELKSAAKLMIMLQFEIWMFKVNLEYENI